MIATVVTPGDHLPLHKVITVLFDYIPYTVYYTPWLFKTRRFNLENLVNEARGSNWRTQEFLGRTLYAINLTQKLYCISGLELWKSKWHSSEKAFKLFLTDTLISVTALVPSPVLQLLQFLKFSSAPLPCLFLPWIHFLTFLLALLCMSYFRSSLFLLCL